MLADSRGECMIMKRSPMSEVADPQYKYELLGDDGVRASAVFEAGVQELLKVEVFSDAIGINWTTGLGAVEISKIVQNILPGPAEVDIFHWDEIKKFSSDESGRILDEITARDTIRMTYSVEPSEVACSGLLVAWRIATGGESYFNRLGVLIDPTDSLVIPESLIDVSASRHVKSTPSLLETLIEQAAQQPS